MKILKLAVQGFRSLYDIEWVPANLNVIIGPNASGKSNLLRLLEMVSASAQGELGRYVQREGGIESLIWDGTSENITIRVKASPAEESVDLIRDALTYDLTLTRFRGRSVYRIQHELLGKFYRYETGEKAQPFKLLERNPHRAVVFDDEERGLVAQQESLPEDETLLSAAAGLFPANRTLPAFQKHLASWTVYQDLHTNREATIRQAIVSRPEKRVSPDGQNLTSVLHTLYTGDREFKREINAAMTAAYGQEFEELIFPPAADQRIQLRVRWRSLHREQSAADLSDGTIRFLFLLAVLANPDPPPLVAIDEPETGLHPSMFPIVAEYASQAASRSQVIFATHSPSFLDAFRDVAPATTVVEWKEGKTSLRVRSGEELAYWLKEYSLGELFRSGELEAVE